MRAVRLMPDPDAAAAAALCAWLAGHERVFVLTGAGISTASGIPDYRGPDGQWKRRAPVTWQAFLHDPATRARYWARSFVGWPAVACAQPNAAHAALAALEAQGRVRMLVTQNVDGLHARAGQRRVVDLHGRMDEVICIVCGARSPRAVMQRRLAALHPEWTRRAGTIAPDGDADVECAEAADLRVPACERCAGVLKPDVVFFGENVPGERVASAQDALARADALLVVGSSLMVYSGFRFARMARAAGMPLAILTRGMSRADPIATLKLDADCVPVLRAAALALA